MKTSVPAHITILALVIAALMTVMSRFEYDATDIYKF